MLELALTLSTIVRRNEIRSLEPEFPMATPFTMVAGAPIPARVIARPGYTTENAAGSVAPPGECQSTVSP